MSLDPGITLTAAGSCLPRELAGRVLRDVVTGAEIKPTYSDDEAWIFASEAFATLPFAILAG